jgi:hypothetical protein
MDLRMKNYALFKCTAQQLLSDELDGDDPIYEDEVLTHVDGSLSTVHHQISRSQAKAIMRRIVQDDVISEALRNGIEEARLNPNGNMPVNGAHPVDPAVALIEERAILPTLGTRAPVFVVLYFARIGYDNIQIDV